MHSCTTDRTRRLGRKVPKPVLIDETDAIVRVDATTICGTDLHILKGDVPAVTDGRILGHEAVGTVEQVGMAVKHVAPGDRVLVSCITACGSCRFCRQASFGQCTGWGRVDPRPPHRRHPGRVRAGPVRRHVDVSGARRCGRRGHADGGRHPADRLRGRRPQRLRPAG